MEYSVIIAIVLGVSLGMIFGCRLSNRLSLWFSKSTRAPRLVKYCSLLGALMFLVLSFPISIFVGGMLGGGWGEEASIAVGYGSIGVPVGLASGIAILLSIGIVIGAILGGTLGKLLSHNLPETVLTRYFRGGNFQLKDASVRGGEMLISDPRKWQELEDEHLSANLR